MMTYKDEVYKNHVKLANYNSWVRDIINNSEKGRFRNICSGVEDCKNLTRYKYPNQQTKIYNYYCTECLRQQEFPI